VPQVQVSNQRPSKLALIRIVGVLIPASTDSLEAILLLKLGILILPLLFGNELLFR
jgi:hypothetical protein